MEIHPISLVLTNSITCSIDCNFIFGSSLITCVFSFLTLCSYLPNILGSVPITSSKRTFPSVNQLRCLDIGRSWWIDLWACFLASISCRRLFSYRWTYWIDICKEMIMNNCVRMYIVPFCHGDPYYYQIYAMLFSRNYQIIL